LNVLGGFLMLRCALFELNCLKAWDPWCRCSLNIYMHVSWWCYWCPHVLIMYVDIPHVWNDQLHLAGH
jgi:hypothetical protein